MLPDDLPQDFLEFNARFGTDEQCREYLFRARWPDGFRCDGCGHDHAYTLRTRLVYECVACRKQHSLLAGTLFEQTKTALARWFNGSAPELGTDQLRYGLSSTANHLEYSLLALHELQEEVAARSCRS